jgi:hypothetical protein
LPRLAYPARVIDYKDPEGSESPAQTQQHLGLGTALRRQLGDSSADIPDTISEAQLCSDNHHLRDLKPPYVERNFRNWCNRHLHPQSACNHTRFDITRHLSSKAGSHWPKRF